MTLSPIARESAEASAAAPPHFGTRKSTSREITGVGFCGMAVRSARTGVRPDRACRPAKVAPAESTAERRLGLVVGAPGVVDDRGKAASVVALAELGGAGRDGAAALLEDARARGRSVHRPRAGTTNARRAAARRG